MYNYSKIVALRIRNFRCLGDIYIDFKQSNIVSLVAGNECGKTSVVKAIESIMYNSNQRKSKGYIRTGTTGFSVMIAFENGYVVERARTETANIYRMWDENQNLIVETSKLDNGEVPPQIKELMGVVQERETGELMNIRTYENLLLFVLTKDSENYKVMYDALKVDNIVNAIKVGKEEAATYRRKIESNMIAADRMKEQIRGIQLRDLTPITHSRDLVDKGMYIIEKADSCLRHIEQIRRTESQLGVFAEALSLADVDIETALKFQNISNLVNRIAEMNDKLSNVKEVDALGTVDVALFSKLGDCVGKLGEIDRIKSELVGVESLDEVESIDVSVLQKLNNVVDKMHSIERLKNSGAEEIDNIDEVNLGSLDKFNRVLTAMEKGRMAEEKLKQGEAELAEMMEQLRKVGSYREDLGGFVKQCSNCGEEMVLTLEEMEALVNG